MFGRIMSKPKIEPTTPKEDDTEDVEEALSTPMNVTELIGGSGISLDGRSLVLPTDRDRDIDEVSSINTYNDYYTKGDMRILGTVEHDGDGNDPHRQEGPVEDGRKSSQAQQHDDYEHKQDYKFHSARPKDDKTLDSTDSDDEGCMPLWIIEAPTWLKLVIVLSTALLVGAIVLIGVGAALAVQEEQSKAPNDEAPASSSFSPPPPFGAPVQAPTTPSIEDTTPSSPMTAPTNPPQSTPTNDPPGSIAPTKRASAAPTSSPTAAPTSSKVSFFVIGGRFTGDNLDLLPDQLQTLPNLDGDTVMFHLGDWNSPFATSCVESSYQTNLELYQNSAVPVYFVPGDNEFNDCPNPQQAYGFWYDYTLDFETKFWPAPTAWNVTRQAQYAENFAYVHNSLLVVGINLVGGVVHDDKEWEARHQADLEWIDESYYAFEGQFEMMVVLAHADPDIQSNGDFFVTFYERVENDYDLQVIFVHRNLGVESWGLEPSYNGIANLIVVVVEGSVWPPMLVEIDTQAGIVDINQEQWYLDYVADGL